MVAKTVNWLYQLHSKGLFAYGGVEVHRPSKKEFWSYQQWYRRIKTSFEMIYFVKESKYGWYYKDTTEASNQDVEYQFRPNFVIVEMQIRL